MAAVNDGRVIGGRYALLERLGSGAAGVVWRAEERVDGQVISEAAVKEFTADVDLEEMRVLARLCFAPPGS